MCSLSLNTTTSRWTEMPMRGVIIAVIVSQVALSACTADPTKPAFEPTFYATTCPKDVTSVVLTPATCGFLNVLEDRSKPDGRQIKLFVVRVEPAGGHPAPDPVFVAGDIGEPPGWADNAGLAQRVNREVILMDPRGTGRSEPNLACPEVKAMGEEIVGSRSSDPATREDLRSAVDACRGRLAGDGVDLSRYDLQQNAADVDELRQALDIDRWNLISHGTMSRILLEVVRRYPTHIRTVTLDTPEFPQMSDPIAAITGTKDALAQLFADCSRQPTCKRRFPHLSMALREAVAQLDTTPIEVMITDSSAARAAGHPISVVVDGGAFIRAIRAMVSDIDLGLAASVPATIYAALGGMHADVSAAAKLLSDDSSLCVGYEPKCGSEHQFVEGAYYSLICADEVPSAGSSQLEQLADGDPGYMEAYAGGPYVDEICPAWGVERAGPETTEPVTSDIPMLVYVGAYDSFGSAEITREAVSTLSGAFIVSAPFAGHNAMSTSECYLSIRNAWIETPMSPPETSCMEEIPTLRFATS